MAFAAGSGGYRGPLAAVQVWIDQRIGSLYVGQCADLTWLKNNICSLHVSCRRTAIRAPRFSVGPPNCSSGALFSAQTLLAPVRVVLRKVSKRLELRLDEPFLRGEKLV